MEIILNGLGRRIIRLTEYMQKRFPACSGFDQQRHAPTDSLPVHPTFFDIPLPSGLPTAVIQIGRLRSLNNPAKIIRNQPTVFLKILPPLHTQHSPGFSKRNQQEITGPQPVDPNGSFGPLNNGSRSPKGLFNRLGRHVHAHITGRSQPHFKAICGRRVNSDHGAPCSNIPGRFGDTRQQIGKTHFIRISIAICLAFLHKIIFIKLNLIEFLSVQAVGPNGLTARFPFGLG